VAGMESFPIRRFDCFVLKNRGGGAQNARPRGQPYTILSDGSSIKETEMLALNILNTFYGQNANSRGTAQAKAVLFFILVATIGLLQLSANRKKEVQQ